jgi:DTW domain-containing protein YfiP
LPETPITINGKIIILQHPDEEKRNLKTGPMLFHGMTSGQCLIFYGKKFPSPKHQGLKEMLMEPHTYVLYPGPQSKSITTVSHSHPKGEPYNLVLIDGTWQQAKSMYFHSPFLHSLPQVQGYSIFL